MSEKAKRCFLLSWLKRAKTKKLFNPVVYNEINWLISDLHAINMQGIESRFLYIYQEIGKLIEAEAAKVTLASSSA